MKTKTYKLFSPNSYLKDVYQASFADSSFDKNNIKQIARMHDKKQKDVLKDIEQQRQGKEAFDNYLDSAGSWVQVFGYSFSSSYALKELDPIAYEEEYLKWADAVATAAEELALLKG